jgi:hypothetical protein
MWRRTTLGAAQRPRRADDPARRLPRQPKKAEADRGMFRMAENDCPAAQGPAPRDFQGGLGVHLCLRGLQPVAPAKPVGSAGLVQGRSVSAGGKIGFHQRTSAKRTLSYSLCDKPGTEFTSNPMFFSSLLKTCSVSCAHFRLAQLRCVKGLRDGTSKG